MHSDKGGDYHLTQSGLSVDCMFVSAVPSAAPDDVAVEVMNSSMVNVTWKQVPKDKLHGHLGGYRVKPERKATLLSDTV